MTICFCKSRLQDAVGGEGFAFHPLFFFLACPLHPTRTERFRESAIQGIDFAPPLIRVWSLVDYGREVFEDVNSQAPSRSASPMTPIPLHGGQAKVKDDPDNATFDPHTPNDHSELHLVEMSHGNQQAGQLETRGAELRLSPKPDDWERYKEIIEDLYMRRNMNLSQVRSEMEKRHGITATSKMYKYRFAKWGWHKYSSKSQRLAVTARRPILQPSGKSRTKPVKMDCPRPSKVQASQKTGRGETILVYPLLHQNDHARHIHTVLTMMQQYIVGETETDIDFDTRNPCLQTTGLFSAGHSTNMYQTLVSALGAFTLNEFVLGGRLLRRAFRILEHDINHLGVIRSIEYCFSIPHLFVAYGRTDLAVLLLEYMSPRLRMIPKRHPLAIICEPLLRILQTSRQPSQDSLERVLRLGADTYAAVRPGDHRAVLYFRSRFSSITSTEAAEEILAGYQDLIKVYLETLTDMDPKVLSIEREMLDFATRYRLQPVETLQWCLAVISRLESHYAKKGVPPQGWSVDHQQLWIDINSLWVEILAFGGNLDLCIEKARDINDFLEVTRDCLPPNKWHAIHSCQVWFEMMLRSVGKMEEVEEFRKVRTSSAQYRLLDKESVEEEQELLKSGV